MGVLLSTSEQVTTRKERETPENSDVPLVIARRLLWSASGDEVLRRFAFRFLEASENDGKFWGSLPFRVLSYWTLCHA